MDRKAAIAGAVLLLATSTLAVVWAGRNWPPPRFVLRYGLPGSQGPTGRVANVEGFRFVEFDAGYCFVSPGLAPRARSGLDRFRTVLLPDTPGRSTEAFLRQFDAYDRWVELPHVVWLSPVDFVVWEARVPGSPSTELPIRGVRGSEIFVTVPEDPGVPPPRRGCRHDSQAGMAFALAPGEESLVEPYLVSGE